MNQSLWQDRSNEDIECCLPLNSLLLKFRRYGPYDRRAIASHAVPAGQVLVRNVPLAFAVHNRDERCAACFQKHETLMRCSKCRETWYCSRECQVQDFPLHRMECREGSSAQLFGSEDWQHNARLLLRTFLKLHNPEKEECSVLQNFAGDKNNMMQTCSCSRRHFFQLQPSQSSLDPHDFRILQTASRMIRNQSRLLEKMGIDITSDPGWLEHTLENILRRFRVNNFGMVDTMVRLVGGGVYPLGALLNHSCAPNCILRYTDRGVLEIVAARNIAESEELTHSYVELVAPTRKRQDHLQHVYGFSCQCSRCRGDKVSLPLDYKSMHREKLIGWILDRYNPNPTTSQRSPDESMGRASKVIEVSLDYLLQPDLIDDCAIQRASVLQQQAKLAMAHDDISAELFHLTQAVDLLQGHPPNGEQLFSLELYQVLCQRLSSSLIAAEGLDETVLDCRHIVAILCLAFSQTPNHPLLGLQLFTLGDLYQAIQQTDRANIVYQWALDTLIISQGPDSDMVQMLREKLT